MSRGRIPPFAWAMMAAFATLTAASADELTGRELLSATLWMQRAPLWIAPAPA